METLASSCSKATINTNGDKGFSSFKDVSLNRAEICLLPSKKLVRIRFLNSLSAKHRLFQPVLASSSSSPESQVDLVTAEIQPEEGSPSKTSHVKFQLQKECSFGDHFFIVGDHPMFGLWDPESAIPLNWTEGHVWAVELDIPVGKTIQFKFLLKDSDGKLLWQPGPDRIFKSWDTEKTIIVLEDWENAEDQKVMEEEQLANQDGLVIDSGTAIVAENLAPAKEELVSDEKPVSDTNSISNLKNESLQVLTEALATGNGTPSQEKPLPIVAENISYQAEDMIANANNGVHGVKRTNYPNDEPLAIPNQNVLVAEDLGNIGGVETIQNPAMADVEVKLVEHEGSPVLVPGLPSFVTHEPILDEEEKNSTNDASVGVNEANYHTLPELDEKQEPEGETREEPKEEVTMTVSKDEEEQQDNQHIQKLQLAREEQSALGHYQSNVLQSDVQWGRKTLQKLLNGLRFLV